MKVLHYLFGLPPVRSGGLVKYALDLAEGQRAQGLDVCLMIPGEIHKNKETVIQKKKYSGFVCYHVVNPVLVTCGKRVENMTLLCKTGNFKMYKEFLKKVSPDIIHVHTLMGMHLAFLQAAQALKISIIFTTHDYYGICPKCSNFKDNIAECKNDGNMCALCMGSPIGVSGLQRQHMQYYMWMKKKAFVNWLEYSKKLLRLKWWLRSKMKKSPVLEANDNVKDVTNSFQLLSGHYKTMFSYITFFHFNSTQTESIYKRALGNIRGKVINISNHSVADNRKVHAYGKTLKLAYLSNRQVIKGYEYLMETLDRLYQDGFNDFECHIYCNEDRFEVPYLKTHKPYKEQGMKKIFDNTDVIIAPSLWEETFGMVVLEAISYGVPAIISKNVGAKDILGKSNEFGIIVDIEKDKNALYDAIKNIYENRYLLEQMNKNIVEAKIELRYDMHVKEITELYRSLKD